MAERLDPVEIVDSIREALVVLTEDWTVEFASRSFSTTFQVAPEDVLGRRLFALGDGQWDIPALRTLLERILPAASRIEAYDVEHDFPSIGRRVMRLNARTTHIRGNGSRRILLAFEDVTQAHDLAIELERQRLFATGVVETVREPLLVLDGQQKVLSANRSFYRTFEIAEQETIGRHLCDLGDGQWNIPALSKLLETVIPDNTTFDDFLVEHDFPGIGFKKMILNARKIHREGNNSRMLLLAFEDVTERFRLEAEAEAALKMSHDLLEELNHRVMNNLAVIGAILASEARHMSDAECEAAFQRIKARVSAVGELYKTLSRRGAIDAVMSDDYIGSIVSDMIESVGETTAGPIDVRCVIDPTRLTTRVAVPLGLVVNELIMNSVKYAFGGASVDPSLHIALVEKDQDLVLTVADNGRGVNTATQAESGLGSRLINAFAAQLRGNLSQQSGETGTTTTLRFPKPQ